MTAYDSIERGAADECEPLRGRRPRTFTLTQLLVACVAVCGCTLAATTAVNTHRGYEYEDHRKLGWDMMDMKDLIGQHDASGCQANLKKAEMQIKAAAQTEVDDLKKPIDDLATTLRDMQGKRESAVKRSLERSLERSREQIESQVRAAAQTEADDLKKPIDAMAAILKNMQGVAESAAKRSHSAAKFPTGEWRDDPEHGEDAFRGIGV